ncbi:ADP-ribose 1''-phosphate phosphatase [Kalmusia sp. IMI 367209]|nr:ADP-ribose 1''-phosphate phosphatase [Kalmusia sp. IMI 367209]
MSASAQPPTLGTQPRKVTAHKRAATNYSNAPASKSSKISNHGLTRAAQPTHSGFQGGGRDNDQLDGEGFDEPKPPTSDAESRDTPKLSDRITREEYENKDGSKGEGEGDAEGEDQDQSHVRSEGEAFTEVSPERQRLIVKEHIGDLFAAPNDAVLVHACNTKGSWGAGIAAQFRKRYPAAFEVYKKHCLTDHNPKRDAPLTGTALLIPPCEKDLNISRHWIGCLFTSAKYGKAKDPPNIILMHTATAVTDLLTQVGKAGYQTRSSKDARPIVEVRMCQINAGLFAVPWEDTKKVLEDLDVEWKEVNVYSLASTAPSSSGDGLATRPYAQKPVQRLPPKKEPSKKPAGKKQATLTGLFKLP